MKPIRRWKQKLLSAGYHLWKERLSLQWLNDVFDIHRNEKIIKLIKEKVDDYDMEWKQKADSLMQNNPQNKKNK